MNESDPSPINLDELRLMPAWLREDAAEPANRYATHNYPLEGERERRGSGGGGRRPDFGGGRERSNGGGGGRGDGQRRSGPPDRARSGGGPSRSGPRDGRRDDRGRDDRRPVGPAPVPQAPAPVGIQFLPDERCLESIVKQIRTRHLAYPLFGLARMFLQEPARHWLEISVLPAAAETGTQLHQLGDDGPVALDRAALEKIGFEASKDQFYVEETVQKDPPKGNYTSVARCRLSGTILGPTNYHGYQAVLRGLYERRFSRQMSFEDYRRNVEVVSDAALVEKWKEDVRTVKTIKTLGDAPEALNSPAEARVHFRQHHFETMLRTGPSFKLPGAIARNLPEPGMMQAIRQAHEPELRYPGRFVQLLREALQNAGLHIFKHRKRFVYVAASRPATFSGSEVLTETVAAILKVVGENPLITRKLLADRILAGLPVAAEDASPEDPYVKARNGLLADLRFLVQSGHLIEFHNGTFDLPLPPKPKAPVAASTPIIGEAVLAAPAPEEEIDPESVAGDSPVEDPAPSKAVTDPAIGAPALDQAYSGAATDERAAPSTPAIGEGALTDASIPETEAPAASYGTLL